MADSEPEQHGLQYPPSLSLSSLPVLSPPSSSNAPPVRALTSRQFAALHTAHLTAHAPDAVLFPFLHGLEGDNPHQRAFFTQWTGSSGSGGGGGGGGGVVPRFRGLVWTMCEEDLEGGVLPFPLKRRGEDGEWIDDDDEEEEGEEDDLEDDEEDEDIDGFSDEAGDAFDMDAMDTEPTTTTETHMHPVAHRPKAVTTPTNTNANTSDASEDPLVLDHRPRAASSSSTSSSTNSSSLLDSPVSCPSPATSFAPSEFARHATKQTTSKPVVLTSTFRACDLLQETGDGGSEFIPPKVPDGISLRNFGIQVVRQSHHSPLVLITYIW